MKIRTLNDIMIPLAPETLSEWESYKEELVSTIRFASSIDLLRHTAPLNALVFDTVIFDGFAAEKVIIQTLPGFYLTGNIFRPIDTSKKYPAVLNPHGHWDNGRITTSDIVSIPQRCANLALRGMVAFVYDMVGYVDSTQICHRKQDPEWLRWNYGRFSLQLNNSRKALDFVSSLPYVDSERIGCTGCSGGGTQTYFLTATDDRIKVSAPINMASTRMQGGCICENAPFLRTDFCNMDYVRVTAPRPLFLSASDGDWTLHSEEIEFPAVEKIYELYGVPQNFEHFFQSSDHCYNKPTRERVYRFFCKHFGLEDKYDGEVIVDIDTDLLTIKDIRPYVEKEGFIESDEQLFEVVKKIISDNLAMLSAEEKEKIKNRVYLVGKSFELDIPYWFRNEDSTPLQIMLGSCPSSADYCGTEYYHTYNYADDTKRVSALTGLLKKYPDAVFRASGKTAALLNIAAGFVPDAKTELFDADDSEVLIPGSCLVR